MTPALHLRKPGPKRSPHRTGRITPDNVLEADPRRSTMCGADPTDKDMRFGDVKPPANRAWYLTHGGCRDCLAGRDQQVFAS